MDRRKFLGYPKLATKDGSVIKKSRAKPRFRSMRVSRRMNSHKIFGSEERAASAGGIAYFLPILGRDGLTFLPLDNHPLGAPDLACKLNEGIPKVENIVEGIDGLLHDTLITRDYSSRQRGTTRPVHKTVPTGTLSPMGRGVTPEEFSDLFCGRVKLLVKESGYSNKEIAGLLGVEVDTMRRYQNRLLMPHHLIPRFCELVGVKPEFLFRSAPASEKEKVSRSA